MLVRCSGCSQRPESKFANVTWAWRNADGARRAYRQRLCVACFVQHVLAIHKDMPADARLTCPGCGIDTDDDYDAIYVTAFLPGSGKETYEYPTCGACAARIRIWVTEHGQLLEEIESRGQEQAPSTPTPWQEVLRGLGIQPREA